MLGHSEAELVARIGITLLWLCIRLTGPVNRGLFSAMWGNASYAGPRGFIIHYSNSLGMVGDPLGAQYALSGRAFLGGQWVAALSNYDWNRGGGPRCSNYGGGRPLGLDSTLGSLTR